MQDHNEPFADAAPTVSLREYLEILRRRRAIILQTFVIVLIVGVVYTITQPPVYQATARLLVDPPSANISLLSGTNDPIQDMFAQTRGYNMGTQVELLQTPEIRKQVAEKVGGAMPQISIGVIEGTSIVTVSAEGDNPEMVANAPNTLLDVYVKEVADKRGQELKNAIEFVEEQLAKTTKELRQTEAAIRDFKDKNQVAALEQTRDNQIDLVKDAQAAVVGVRGQIAAVEQRMAATREEMSRMERSGENLFSSVPYASADPVVQQLDEQISNLSLQRDVLLDQDFTKEKEEVKRLILQIEGLKARKRERMQNYSRVNVTRNPQYESFRQGLNAASVELSVLNKQLSSAIDNLATAEGRLNNFPEWETRYDEMLRRRDAAVALSTNFGSKLADLRLRLETRPIPARVMQRASVPGAPVRPNRPMTIVFAGLTGLVLGLCVALMQELFDDRINSPEEAERVLRLPNLGHVPLIEEEGLRLIRDISTFSPLMESYRTLRTNLNFAAVGNPVRSLVVTSSIPAEGKSTTVANLAMAMAYDGKKVIIVDADLRRPSQHHLFKLGASPGLTDILVGTHGIEDVIVPVPGVEGVSLIPAGSPPPNPAELLGSTVMGHFLAQIETMADIVILDSPPALAVADSVVLSARADGVLIVIGYGETKKANVKGARDILGRANANVLGTVLNRMDSAATGYYYGKYYVPATDALTLSSGNGAPATTMAGAVAPGAGAAAPAEDDVPTRVSLPAARRQDDGGEGRS